MSAWDPGAVLDDRYRITRVLGRGGMGVVHQVRHLAWDVDLAVKSPRPERWTEKGREQFVAEAETWVSLGLHPHVCTCHYVRTLDGVPRVFAEYVDGGSLGDWIRDRRLYRGDARGSLARILDVAVQFAWGLAHAHSHGLVHQDVKPANVLIEAAGEQDITAKVTDFGLARARAAAFAEPADAARDAAGDASSSDESVLVSFGGLTRAYASPEQFDRAPLGRRSDVYSYAVSLLEMFTGALTWRVGVAAGEALEAHLARPFTGGGLITGDGPPPVPPGVADLLRRCLRHDPRARPGSMAALADELIHVYEEELHRPYPRTAPKVSELLADEYNNRALSLLDLGRDAEAADAFVAALAADPRHPQATYNAGLARWRRGEITDEDLLTALTTVRGDSGDSWEARLALAQVHLERGDVPAARALLDTLERERPGEPELRTALTAVAAGRPTPAECTETRTAPWYAYERRTVSAFRSTEQEPAPPPALDIKLSADGSRALVVCDGAVRLWDTRTGRCLLTLDRERAAHAADLSPDGRFAVAAGTEDVVRLWSLADGTCLQTFTPQYLKGTTGVVSTRLALDGRLVAAATNDGQVLLWDTRTGRVRHTLDGFQHRSPKVELTPDGRRALTGVHEDGSVRLWDVGTRELLRTLPGYEGQFPVTCMRLSDDGRRAVLVGHNWPLALWDLDTGERLRTLPDRSRSTYVTALSGDHRWALCAGSGPALRLWDLDAGRCLRTFHGHAKPRGHLGQHAVLDLRITDRGRYAVSAGHDETARRWRLPADHPAPPLLSRPRRAAERGRTDAQVAALVADADTAVRQRRTAHALELLGRARALPGHERSPLVLSAWRALGRQTVRAGLRGGWASRVVAEYDRAVDHAALSADGRTAAIVPAGESAIHLWDVATGTRTRIVDGPRGRSTRGVLALSADGGRVMMAAPTGALHAWSTGTGERVGGAEVPRGALRTRFSADGRLALFTSGDESLQLWDLDSGLPVRTLAEGGHHPNTPCGLWLDPAGRFAASGPEDRTIRLWDLATGACVRTFHGHLMTAGSVHVSPDLRLVLSCGSYSDRPVRVWDAATGRQLRAFDTAGDGTTAPHESRSVRLTADGRFALSSGEDATVAVWDVRTGRRLHDLTEHQSTMRLGTLSDDGWYALSSGADGKVRLWELDWDLSE
ncbi:protein kinase [Streptomyces sp. NPDC052225]|uniref:protein kinase domain-containing protein n=1 Tax=Streptomyces sp. NPDC052225 TaxID=3154949 RepID=UPI00342DFF2F